MCSCWGSVSRSSHIETTMVLLRWLWMWPLMLHLFIILNRSTICVKRMSWVGQGVVETWGRRACAFNFKVMLRMRSVGPVETLVNRADWFDVSFVTTSSSLLCRTFFMCQWSGWRQRGIIYLGCNYVRCRCSTCFLMKSHNKRLREFDLFVEVLGREQLLLGNLNLIPWWVSSTCGGVVWRNFFKVVKCNTLEIHY